MMPKRNDSDSVLRSVRQAKSNVYHYLIVILMLCSGILGGTIFDEAQILCEIILWALLSYGLLKIKLSRSDIVLLVTFLVTSTVSFFLNEFNSFALNFKIFGLCIFTFIYFRQVHFNPAVLIKTALLFNIILIVHQFVFGHFVIESAWFFGEYKGYANDRPVGLFLVPHASSFFIVIYVLYMLYSKSKNLLGGALFAFALMTQSLTSIVASLAQVSNYIISKSRVLRYIFRRSNLLIFVIVPLVILYYSDQFMDLLRASSYTRYYSVETILSQVFDPRFYSGLFTPFPKLYSEYILWQEATFTNAGSEIGLIKVFVEGGIVLGFMVLIMLIRELKYFRVFIVVSLLHYSFIINMPFMLFLMLIYNREISAMTSSRYVHKRQNYKERLRKPDK